MPCLKILVAAFSVLTLYECKELNCCRNENGFLDRTKNCTNGRENVTLDCKTYYAENETSVTINAIDKSVKLSFDYFVAKDQFCHDIEQKIYIVCVDEDPPHNLLYLSVLEYISVIFLLVTIVIYLLVPEHINLQTICIVHSLGGLLMAFLVLATMNVNNTSELLCHVYPYVLYVSFLYAFFWLNVYSFDIWKTTAATLLFKSSLNWKVIYHVYGIGGPVALFILTLIVELTDSSISLRPNFVDSHRCWFKNLESQVAYLYVPIAILLTLNMIFGGLTLIRLWKETHKCEGRWKKVATYRFAVCIKLIFVMGISWFFEVLSGILESKYPSIFWTFCDVVNSLQGVILFLILVVFRKKILHKALHKWFPRVELQWKTIKDDGDEDTEVENEVEPSQIANQVVFTKE